ncbi:MAG: rRNA maturation RNase YbeY [Duncaniella sp.]|nr:rRNA maturation RNase YbeY [Duncaniella sp.]
MKIEWLTDTGTDMPSIDTALLNEWIAKVVTAHSRVMGPLVYIFCDDEKIIEVNRQFLNHDYYTDIITFDYSRGRMVSGDMFISLDTVETNADLVGATFIQELHRVIIHGVLHLCGINDKGPGEREIMETNENDALAILQELQNNKD